MKQWLRAAYAVIITLALILATGVPGFAGNPMTPDLYEQVEIFQHKKKLGEKQITLLNQDLQWLENKISTMELIGRPVPPVLHRSVAYKKTRLAMVAQIVNHFRDILNDLKGGLLVPEKSAKNVYGSITKDLRKSVHDENKTSLTADSYSQAASALMEQMQVYSIAEWFDIRPSRRHPAALVTTLPILFSSGSAVVAPEYDGFFKKISAFVKDQPMHIIVDGFADPDPINTRKYPSNFELGSARASNVIHALTNCGVDPSLFKAGTTGKYRFPDDRPMSEEKSMERYVRITLLPKAS